MKPTNRSSLLVLFMLLWRPSSILPRKHGFGSNKFAATYELVFELASLCSMRLFFCKGMHGVPDNGNYTKQRCEHTACQCTFGLWCPSNQVRLREWSPSVRAIKRPLSEMGHMRLGEKSRTVGHGNPLWSSSLRRCPKLGYPMLCNDQSTLVES